MIVYFMWFMKFMVVQSKKYYDKTILFKLINYTFTNKAVFPFLKNVLFSLFVYFCTCVCVHGGQSWASETLVVSLPMWALRTNPARGLNRYAISPVSFPLFLIIFALGRWPLLYSQKRK